MKKGISLIVLVITVIVLAILAGAIIISISNTNVITETAETRIAADLANAKAAVNLAYSNAVALGLQYDAATGKAYRKAPTVDANTGNITSNSDDYMTAAEYYDAIDVAFGKTDGWAELNYVVTVNGDGCPTSVTTNQVATN